MISRWIGIIYVIHKQILYTFRCWQMCSSCPQTEAVFLQIVPQTGCPRRCKVTLVAFVWLFSSVCLQMSPQATWIRTGIFTLVAFVWLFSAVGFQMCPQSTLVSAGIFTLWYRIALDAFAGLFSTVGYQMFPQMACLRKCRIALVAFVWIFSAICHWNMLHCIGYIGFGFEG